MNAIEVVKQRLAEILAAFALLTRLPVPLQAHASGRSAVWAYPIVGAVVGALAGAVYWIAIALSSSGSARGYLRDFGRGARDGRAA